MSPAPARPRRTPGGRERAGAGGAARDEPLAGRGVSARPGAVRGPGRGGADLLLRALAGPASCTALAALGRLGLGAYSFWVGKPAGLEATSALCCRGTSQGLGSGLVDGKAVGEALFWKAYLK